jgi:hypothetical protein
MVAKAHPVNAEFETRAKNLLKGELKHHGVTYAQLAEKLTALGVPETERRLYRCVPAAMSIGDRDAYVAGARGGLGRGTVHLQIAVPHRFPGTWQ